MAKIALVTGGSGAIVRAISDQLAKDGYALAVHYRLIHSPQIFE